MSSSSTDSKVPIDTLPTEIRMKVYDFAIVAELIQPYQIIEDRYGEFEIPPKPDPTEIPWGRIILFSGIFNDFEALEIALIQGRDQERISWELIALSGNLQLLKWAYARFNNKFQLEFGRQFKNVMPAWDEKVFAKAAMSGNLNMLKWLHQLPSCVHDRYASVLAARQGHLHVLKWLHEQHCVWDEITCAEAADVGHFEILKWLHENHCPWDELTCARAAESGHWEILKWLRLHNCPWHEGTTDGAARGGHLDILKWLEGQGCRLGYNNICYAAAEGGSVAVMEWLHAQRFPWNEEECYAAEENGHVELINWFREHYSERREKVYF
jgi:hypothetical protein